MADKVKIKFVRNTTPLEDDHAHAEGETLDVLESSAERWIRRGAAELAASAPPKTPGKKGGK